MEARRFGSRRTRSRATRSSLRELRRAYRFSREPAGGGAIACCPGHPYGGGEEREIEPRRSPKIRQRIADGPTEEGALPRDEGLVGREGGRFGGGSRDRA